MTNHLFKNSKIESLFDDIEDNDRTNIKKTIENNEKLTENQMFELAHNGFDPNLGSDCCQMIYDIIKNNCDDNHLTSNVILKMASNKYFIKVFSYIINKKINIPQDCIVIAIMNNNIKLMDLLCDKADFKIITKTLGNCMQIRKCKNNCSYFKYEIKVSKNCFNIMLKRNKGKLPSCGKDDFEKGRELSDIPELNVLCESGYFLHRKISLNY